ncbi:UbiA family prenyltransferase [candidate division KSB1 bacterium]|nr:UbiA family prenyltransferase [candidate division KSB1 bacterium]
MKVQRWVTLGDYLFIMRPTLFFPVWTVFLIGYLRSGTPVKSIGKITPWLLSTEMWSTTILPVGIGLSVLCGGIFILNQIQDQVTDRQNNKLLLLAHHHVPLRIAWIEGILCIILPILWMGWIETSQGVLFFALFLLAGWAYSFPPFQWKDHALLGLLTNALTGLIIFSIGWQVRQPLTWEVVKYALPYVLAISVVYLYTTIPDAPGDALANKITFAVKHGFRKTTQLALGLGLLTCVAAVMVQDWMIGSAAILALPLFIRVCWTQRLADVLTAIKAPILFLALVVCWKIPCYWLLILVNFYSAKWYYKKRFNLNYPSFSD